jgi:hypothetical protein
MKSREPGAELFGKDLSIQESLLGLTGKIRRPENIFQEVFHGITPYPKK